MKTNFWIIPLILIAALVFAQAPAFAAPGSDVAVTYVSAPSSSAKGSFVNVDVYVINLGTQNETFNVTLTDATDSALIGVQSVALAPNSTRTLSFGFNTTASSAGNHTIRAEASIVGGENNTANNIYAISMYITEPEAPVHDVAVSSLYVPASAIKGYPAYINITITNKGTQAEIFNVTLFDNTDQRLIGVQAVNLSAGASQGILFAYNTSAASVGNHTITAYASVVQGENNTADNSKSGIIEIIAPDTTAPSAITNFFAGNATTNSVLLLWNAPGDDGNTGTAAQYDIRYSTSPINDSNWASATQVSGEPAPSVAGTPQWFIATGLSSNTTYYFAIKTRDEVPNWSPLSNVPYATTAPAISISLAEAVDNTNLYFAAGGNSNWFGQASTYYYGGDAAQSGAIGNNGNTWMQTTVNGPGIVTFYWKVSSERYYDYLRFYVNGVQKASINGEVGWTAMSYNLTSGNQTIKWAYTKDVSIARGSDAGWVDKVVYTPR